MGPKRARVGELWEDDFAGEAFADFPFPRRRITGTSTTRTTDAPRVQARGTAPRPVAAQTRALAAAPTYAREPSYASEPTYAGEPSYQGEPPTSGSRYRWDDDHATGSAPGRRTVTIRGRGAERHLWEAQTRRRPARRPYERSGFRPDRTAMWAVILGLLLILVAATSSKGAVLTHHTAAAHLARPAHVITVAPRAVRFARP